MQKATTQDYDLARKSLTEVNSLVQEIETVYLMDRPRRLGVERRAARRINVTMPVNVVPMDETNQPVSYLYYAISRDISTSGNGLVATRPIAEGNVLLTIEPYHRDAFEIAARVVYCKDFGYYYQVGCEFVVS